MLHRCCCAAGGGAGPVVGAAALLAVREPPRGADGLQPPRYTHPARAAVVSRHRRLASCLSCSLFLSLHLSLPLPLSAALLFARAEIKMHAECVLAPSLFAPSTDDELTNDQLTND